MKINSDFIKNKLGDECALVPTGDSYTNGVFMLNETAEKIYDLLCDGKSRGEIIDALLKEYDSPQAEVAENTDEYIEKLKKAGILIND